MVQHIDPGIAGAIGAGVPLILWEVGRLVARKVGKASTIPKRLLTVESVLAQVASEMPIQTRGILALCVTMKAGKCNGEVDATIKEIKDLEDERAQFFRNEAIGGAKKEAT